MYDSYMISPYHRILVELGHPELDVKILRDGSWGIREFYRSPVVPSLTPWKWVLKNVRNELVTRSFIERWVSDLDPRNRGFLERADAESAALAKMKDDALEEKAERIMQLGKQLAHNDDLMNDAHTMGWRAFDLEHMAKRVYKHQPWKLKNL
jgi:hypothetical protein